MGDAYSSSAPSTPLRNTAYLLTPSPSEPEVIDDFSDDSDSISGSQAVNVVTPSSSGPPSLLGLPSSSGPPSPPDPDSQPTWPNQVDRTKIHARACWQPNQHMNDLMLDIHWVGQHNSAFIKLHTSLRLEGVPAASQYGLINAYIFMYPERIRRLSFTENPEYAPFGPFTVALTFELSRQPTLVLPKPYSAFGQGAEAAVRSLRNLIQQSDFTIYALIPTTKLSPTWLSRFCNDITEQRLTTIMSLSTLRGLYQGHDVEVIEGAKQKKCCDESSATRLATELPDMAAMQALLENALEVKLTAHERRMEEMLSAHEHKVKEMLSVSKSDIADNTSSMEQQVKDEVSELTDTIKGISVKDKDEVQESV